MDEPEAGDALAKLVTISRVVSGEVGRCISFGLS